MRLHDVDLPQAVIDKYGEFCQMAAEWSGSVTQTLRQADDQAKESAWNRWIERYLRRRVESNPIQLDAEESGTMCEWALILKPHYAEIVELLFDRPGSGGQGRHVLLPAA